MRFGLLLCDHVSPPLRHVDGDYDAMFRRWIGGESTTWNVVDLTRGERPADLEECDAWFASGSRASVYDDAPWIHGFAAIVRQIHDAGRPFVGVCFGHQMIAHALGGRVTRSPRGCLIGARRFPIGRTEPWMSPPRDHVGLLMSCCDQVDELPAGASVLGGDERCPVAVFRVGSLLGIQGHPEWTPAFAEALMVSREEGLGKQEVAEARRTMSLPLDDGVVAAWALRFVETARAGAARP